ncbi:FAD-dependent oxidoreductase [Emergencia sp.]|uniref:FAD-dependent oxidoreductase n=1 Tax=Emergencia sp. TaxID=1926557 RepID=UPI003AF05EF5
MKNQRNDQIYDVVIIGGGPAGLTAALYLARARHRVVVVEKEQFGGQIATTLDVVNYPGVEKTSGPELTETMRLQAENFGVEFLMAEAEELSLSGDIKTVKTSRGELSCFCVLLAAGAKPRLAGFLGEEIFRGHGVAYCATCDGEFFTDKDVFVVGGGFAAAEESVFLAKYARQVTILMRSDDFTCAKATADMARSHEKIKILPNVEVEEVKGDSVLRYLRYRNLKNGEVTEYRPPAGETFGLFIFAGYEPATELVRDIAELDDQGYVLTDERQKTNVEGLYAAGDICVKSLRQVVTAVGEGALAATELEHYAAAMQRKTGIQPRPQGPKLPEERDSEEVHLSDGESLFTADMLKQLNAVFEKMQHSLILKLYLDNRPISAELRNYMEVLAALTEKLSVEVAEEGTDSSYPCVKICSEDGTETGLAFHGVPGGHEFTSFILGLYNAAGPGQAVEQEVIEMIQTIKKPVEMKIMISLSCTMCPELVTAAQRIAAESEFVRAEVYDLNHFPDLKDRYQVMSVPCMVINDREPMFGKKNIRQLLDMIGGL